MILAIVLIATMMMPQVVFATPENVPVARTVSTTRTVQTRAKKGWVEEGKNLRYYNNNNTYVKSAWKLINKRWFYFNKKGYALTGWQTIKGKRYYFKPSGAVANKGRMLKGWQVIDGKDCYFDGDGVYDAKRKKGQKTIAIDPGHQRRGDSSLEIIGPGATQRKPRVASGTYGKWSGLHEYQLNLTVSKKLEKELRKRGYNVYMIRTTHNVNISNSQRAKNAAKAGADILVRVHANGDSNNSVAGALTMAPGTNNRYLKKKNITASRKLSKDIINEFCKATGARNRGVQSHNDMTGINWSTIPVTIMEMGFMSNRTDDLNMAKPSYQTKMVQGMANGIDRYFK